MADVVMHCLSAKNIQKLLLDAGVISSRTLHGRRGREVFCQNVLDMKKCCSSEWEKEEIQAIIHGVVDFSKKNTDGKHGVRRDLTEEEIEELHYWPIDFDSNDSVVWQCCWKSNDDPAFFISKLFPDVEFRFEMSYEGRNNDVFCVNNGEFTAVKALQTQV